MPFRALPFFRVLTIVLMSALVTGGTAASQMVELTEEICATLDVDASGTVSEEEARGLIELGFNLVGEEEVNIDEEDFEYVMNNCGELLPAGTPTDDTELAAHPANVYTGTCDSLGDIAAPLNDVAPIGFPVGGAATPALAIGTPVPEDQETEEATPLIDVEGVPSDSVTVVQESLEELISGEHVIAVHQSAVNFDDLIACGDIAGEPTDGQLVVQLEELNDSGYSGEALLESNDDDTTTVTIALQESGA